MSESRLIYCCSCSTDVDARLTDGLEVYPHRKDLHKLPFWKCDTCRNHVGCHHKTASPTNPLGVIPNAEIKKARMHLHALIDPAWQSGSFKRGALYAKITNKLGYQYHTAEIRSVDEARKIYKIAKEIIELAPITRPEE